MKQSSYNIVFHHACTLSHWRMKNWRWSVKTKWPDKHSLAQTCWPLINHRKYKDDCTCKEGLHRGCITPPTYWEYIPKINLVPDSQNILRQSYNKAKVTINLRRTSNLQNHLIKNGKLFIGKIHVQNRHIVRDSVCKLAYNIPVRNFSTF